MNIQHQVENNQFCVEVEGHLAHVDYVVAAGALDIRHTIVPQEIGGRGIAGALVKAAYDYAREAGLQPMATCSYAVKWLEKHPEYQGCASGDYAGEGTCAL